MKSVITVFHFAFLAIYYGYGDTFSYYRDAYYMWKKTETLQDFYYYVFYSQNNLPQKLAVFEIEQQNSTFFVSKIVYVLGYISFKSYLLISFIFSYYAYLGVWMLYLVVKKHFGDNKNYYYYFICLFPSTLFWSSIILKDSICIGSLGIIFYYTYRFIIKRKIYLFSLVPLLISCYLLITIKSYIFFAMVLSCLIAALINLFYQFHSLRIRFVYVVLLIGFVVFSFRIFGPYLQAYILENAVEMAMQYKGSQSQFSEMGDANSGYSINFEYNILSFFSTIPLSLSATIIRPYLWEAKNPLMLIQAFESTFFVVFFLKILSKIRFKKEPLGIGKNFLLLFSLTFIVLFGFIVGITSFNFGTLARYKIPMLPFLYLIVIYYYYLTNQNKIHEIKK